MKGGYNMVSAMKNETEEEVYNLFAEVFVIDGEKP